LFEQVLKNNSDHHRAELIASAKQKLQKDMEGTSRKVVVRSKTFRDLVKSKIKSRNNAEKMMLKLAQSAKGGRQEEDEEDDDNNYPALSRQSTKAKKMMSTLYSLEQTTTSSKQ
jgi:hypothetical protein